MWIPNQNKRLKEIGLYLQTNAITPLIEIITRVKGGVEVHRRGGLEKVPGKCLESMYLESTLRVSRKFLGSNCKMLGKYLRSTWKVSGKCLESWWKVIGKYLESTWKVSGKYLESTWKLPGR
jgi:hypothetical protein